MSTNHSVSSNEASPASTPLSANNAPKFGTLVPNRIFVGGISANTTDAELQALFSNYGNVKQTKIIADRAGVSKGYGFVTFETEEEARRIQREADNIVFKDRKLNIAPAIKKQPFPRVLGEYDTSSTGAWTEQGSDRNMGVMTGYTTTTTAIQNTDTSQVIPNGTVLYHNGIPITYQNGMAFFSPIDNTYSYMQHQSTTPYSFVCPQAVYLPQHYQYSATAPGQWPSNNQWRLASPYPYGQSRATPGQYLVSSPPALPGSQPTTTEIYPCTTVISPPVYTPPPETAPPPSISVDQPLNQNCEDLSRRANLRDNISSTDMAMLTSYPPPWTASQVPTATTNNNNNNNPSATNMGYRTAGNRKPMRTNKPPSRQYSRPNYNSKPRYVEENGGPLTPPPSESGAHDSGDVLARKIHSLVL